MSKRSKFFLNACRKGRFKEGSIGIVDLPDDDPLLVQVLVRHIYGFPYTIETLGRPATRSSGHGLQLDSPIDFHIRAYAIGEKYDMITLKDAAKAEFAKLVKDSMNNAGFFSTTLKTVYETTPVHDRGLRDVVMEELIKNRDQWGNREEFEKCAVAAGFEMTASLLRSIGELPHGIKIYKCPTMNCKRTVTGLESAASGFLKCPKCKYAQAVSVWEQNIVKRW